MPGRIKSEHGAKLSTAKHGDFLTGKTVSRHGKGTIRITTAIILPPHKRK